MGRADQLAKRVLEEETGPSTGRRVTFEVPPEVPVGALSPDGILRVVTVPADVSDLPDPWRRLRHEVVVDLKMPRDHLDRPALARNVLRREAWWVRHLEQDPAPDAPDPRHFGAWVVAPHLPEWIRLDAARGLCLCDAVGVGCWRVAAYPYDVLWIAANELPLRVELLPFLVARSGRALVEFARWALGVKGPEWLANVVKELPMGEKILDEFSDYPHDDAEQDAMLVRYLRKMLDKYPAFANDVRGEGIKEGIKEGIEEGIEKGISRALGPITHLFERRLARTLSPAERATITARLDTHGPDRLGDVVLDLDAPALAAWLSDPHAR